MPIIAAPVFDSLANFPYGQIIAAPVPAGAGTAFTLAAGQGANFPAPPAVAPFNIVVWPPSVIPISSNAEIMRVTAVNGDQFTVARAQEGSNAVAVLAGYQVMLAITKKALTDMQAAAFCTFQAAAGTAPPAGTAGIPRLMWNTQANEIWGWDGNAVTQIFTPVIP